MTIFARIGPSIAIIAVTIFCALPWGAGSDYRLVLPLLPYALIHRAVERWGNLVPDWLVFLAGFAMDVVGQGPLGYWAFIYLCGYTMVRSSTADRQLGTVESLSVFAVTIVSLGLMQWSVTSIYYLRAAQVSSVLMAIAIASVAYVALRIVIPATAQQPVRWNERLERGQ